MRPAESGEGLARVQRQGANCSMQGAAEAPAPAVPPRLACFYALRCFYARTGLWSTPFRP